MRDENSLFPRTMSQADAKHLFDECHKGQYPAALLRVNFVDAFAAAPGKSTWAAAESRSSAKAAYRFFSNTDVSRDELLDSVSRATVEKMKHADAE